MASGYLDVVAGTPGIAADADDYWSKQVVMVFASSAARDSALTTPLREGMVTYQTDANRVTVYDGSGWVIAYEPVQAWAAPTVANLTVGNGVWTAGYSRANGWCNIYGRFVFGTTSAIAGSLTLTLPSTAVAARPWSIMVQFVDATGSYHPGMTISSSTTAVTLMVVNTAGTYAAAAAFSATVPVVYAVNDELHFAGSFPMAGYT